MSLAIVNIGTSHDGSLAGTPLAGDALVAHDGRIAWIGASGDVTRGDHQTVVNAAGATLVPGLIDSHVHSTFGDYTPRQNTVGFLESYVHGGTTRALSASSRASTSFTDGYWPRSRVKSSWWTAYVSPASSATTVVDRFSSRSSNASSRGPWAGD